MSIGSHLEELYGLPAFTFPGPGVTAELPEPGAVAWRITSDVYDADEEWEDAFARFCSAVDTTRVRALIVGTWQEAYDTAPTAVTEALLAARDRLPALRALFLGDIVFEECEISWIHQTDVSGLLRVSPSWRSSGCAGARGWGSPRCATTDCAN